MIESLIAFARYLHPEPWADVEIFAVVILGGFVAWMLIDWGVDLIFDAVGDWRMRRAHRLEWHDIERSLHADTVLQFHPAGSGRATVEGRRVHEATGRLQVGRDDPAGSVDLDRRAGYGTSTSLVATDPQDCLTTLDHIERRR